MKIKVLPLITIINFIIFANLVVAIVCTIKSTTCASGEFPIFSTYQRNNTHAGNYSEYPQNIICCSDQYLTSSSFKKFCGIGEFSFLAFYNYTDSHVETFNNSVLELRFEDNSSGLVFDSSGNGNHGKIYGSILVDGRYGKALSFDGVDDYVNIPDSASLSISTAITVSFWIYPRTFAPETQAVLSKGSSGSNCNYDFHLYTNTLRWSTCVGGSLNELVATLGAENTWYYIVGTYDGSVKRLYVNGELIASLSQTGILPTNTLPLTIGSAPNWYGTFFNGIIDEVRIYNRALSEDEIKHLYYEYRSCVSSPWICGKIRVAPTSTDPQIKFIRPALRN
jgi:hypothetical protein